MHYFGGNLKLLQSACFQKCSVRLPEYSNECSPLSDFVPHVGNIGVCVKSCKNLGCLGVDKGARCILPSLQSYRKERKFWRLCCWTSPTNERRWRPYYRICSIDESVREIRDEKYPPPNERPGRESLNLASR